jgi:hypothetical protein
MITCCSPKFALFLGIIENIVLLLYISLNGSSLSTILKFGIIIIFMKIIPYYAIIKDEIVKKDVIVTLLLFVLYLLWLHLNDMKILQILDKINKSFIQNKGDTPGIMLIDNILEFIRHRLLHS